jgi:hypothetical protein
MLSFLSSVSLRVEAVFFLSVAIPDMHIALFYKRNFHPDVLDELFVRVMAIVV